MNKKDIIFTISTVILCIIIAILIVMTHGFFKHWKEEKETSVSHVNRYNNLMNRHKNLVNTIKKELSVIDKYWDANVAILDNDKIDKINNEEKIHKLRKLCDEFTEKNLPEEEKSTDDELKTQNVANDNEIFNNNENYQNNLPDSVNRKNQKNTKQNPASNGSSVPVDPEHMKSCRENLLTKNNAKTNPVDPKNDLKEFNIEERDVDLTSICPI